MATERSTRPPSTTPARAGCVEGLGILGAGDTATHVQEDPDRQPRRDRLPRHQDGAANGHRHGRGLFRGRSRRAPRRARRRVRLHRPGAEPRVVPVDGPNHRRLQGDRRRSGPPRLRLPVRERGLRAARRGRGHRLHRAQARVDRGDGRQDRLQEAGGGGRGQHDPGSQRGDRVSASSPSRSRARSATR